MYDNHREFVDWAATYDDAGIDQRSRALHEAWIDSFTIIVLAVIMLGAGLVYWLMARPKRHEQVTVRYNTLTCELRDYAMQMDLSVVRGLVERCIVLERKSCWYYTIVDDKGDIILLFPIGYLQNEEQFKALLSYICRMEWTRIKKVQKGKDLWPEAYQKQKKGGRAREWP